MTVGLLVVVAMFSIGVGLFVAAHRRQREERQRRRSNARVLGEYKRMSIYRSEQIYERNT